MRDRPRLVTLRDIQAGYEGRLVLESVNLEVAEGDFIGMIGPNGGGKSTLLRLILGLMKPYSGKIFYKDNSQKRNIRIGYLPQQSLIDPNFPIKVLDVILSGSAKSSNRNNATLALEKLALAGVDDKADSMIGALSGGQLQRVLIARALMSEPELLLLDEPDTFVDSGFERDFHELMQRLNERMSIVMVSHDAGMISSNVKAIACVNKRLHYHASNLITQEDLDSYGCPIDLITHGEMPHRVLHKH